MSTIQQTIDEGETSATTRRSASDVTKLSQAGRCAALMQAFGALVWIPQAALLSFAVGCILNGEGAADVLLPAVGIVALGIIRATLERAGSRRAFKDAREQLSELRTATIATIASHSPMDSNRQASGQTASIIAEQAEAIVPYIARFRPARMKATLVPLAILCCVFPLSWVAGLVLLIAAPLIPLFMALIGWRAKEASEKHLAEMGSMNSFLLDRLRGISTIRTFDAVDATARQLRQDAENLRQRTMAVLRIAFLSSAVLEFFSALGVAMLAVFIGFHLLGNLNFGAWGYKLTLPQSLFILMLAPAFFEPLRELSSVWHDRASGDAALKALAQLSEAAPRIVGNTGTAQEFRHDQPSRVEIEQLSYSYTENGPTIIRRLNLTVAPGERVAIMAPSGVGKSTLLALIAGLTSAERGTIRIDGIPVTTATAADLRAGMGWIGQTPHIFTRSLQSNVTLGRAITSAELRNAMSDAKLLHLAERRGSAVIGEAGVGISGGEAMRVAVARAAANPQSRLLLADEPTSHLDSQTARIVTDALIAASKGRTLIIATHDATLASRMDRIIQLDELQFAEANA